MATGIGNLSVGRKLSPARAESIRKILGLTRKEIARDMSALAGVQYSRSDLHRWFSTGRAAGQAGGRGPSVSLTLYLRLALREAWKRRCEARALADRRNGDLMARAAAFIESAGPRQLERFEKRLRLSEDELAADQASRAPKKSPASG